MTRMSRSYHRTRLRRDPMAHPGYLLMAIAEGELGYRERPGYRFAHPGYWLRRSGNLSAAREPAANVVVEANRDQLRSPDEPTGPREARPDDRLREIREKIRRMAIDESELGYGERPGYRFAHPGYLLLPWVLTEGRLDARHPGDSAFPPGAPVLQVNCSSNWQRSKRRMRRSSSR